MSQTYAAAPRASLGADRISAKRGTRRVAPRIMLVLLCALAGTLSAFGTARAGYIYWTYFYGGTLCQYCYQDSSPVASLGEQSVHVAPRASRVANYFASSGANFFTFDGTSSPTEYEANGGYSSGIVGRCKNQDATATYYASCSTVTA